jgi:alkanesulfonate monooxygenase SsuD/methylene tetrahydromethanopterin reductase-like flavin-dependent oxidoreductase (luciferase family)
LRLGVVILPDQRWDDAQEKWRRAEALGFDHAWTYDHVVWDGLADSPWFGAVPTLAAAALATEEIRIGTLVASPNFRHPVPFARELMTLDDISGGRITLGMGAGSKGSDSSVLERDEVEVSDWSERFSEFVDLLDGLLRGDDMAFDGHHYSVHRPGLRPGPVQSPRMPFAVAAASGHSMDVVARHAQFWVTNGDRSHRGPPLPAADGAAFVARQMGLLDDACRRQGRDPATIDRLVLTGSRLDSGLRSAAEFAELKAIYEAVGVTDLVVHWPRAHEPYAGDEEVLSQII